MKLRRLAAGPGSTSRLRDAVEVAPASYAHVPIGFDGASSVWSLAVAAITTAIKLSQLSSCTHAHSCTRVRMVSVRVVDRDAVQYGKPITHWQLSGLMAQTGDSVGYPGRDAGDMRNERFGL